jgi:two-component system chemotaxis response regulator CheB
LNNLQNGLVLLCKGESRLFALPLDGLEKPPGDASDDAWEQRFLTTVKPLSRIRVITHPRARLGVP